MKYTNKLVQYAIVFILATGLLVACQTSENNVSESQTEQVTDTHPEHKATAGLTLNNGTKWEADSSTNKNVTELYNVISDANPVVFEDYQKTGKAIQTGINKMISECRMQGPDHDALHHWLEPLMEMNKKMSGVTSADEGKELFGMIRRQLEKYPEYFD